MMKKYIREVHLSGEPITPCLCYNEEVTHTSKGTEESLGLL